LRRDGSACACASGVLVLLETALKYFVGFENYQKKEYD